MLKVLDNDAADNDSTPAEGTRPTLDDLAREIAEQSGKSVTYTNLSEEDYKAALLSAGLPEPFAALIADSDTGAAQGGLFDDSGELGRLIGRPTTPMATTVKQVLGG